MSNLRITSISIADTYGCRAVNFAPGTVTRIAGGNGEGKSSILRALLYVFSGGLDPAVIRKGADRSLVSFELSNGVKITKETARVKPRRPSESNGAPRYRADLEITDSDGSVIGAPQTYIAELSEALAVDPSILLRIDATTVPGRRQLAAELMRLVPLSFSPEEVNRACAYRSTVDVPMDRPDTVALPESPEASLSLDDLKKSVAQITEQRRRVGQTRDDADGAINRLQKSLPEDDGVDYSVQLSELEAYSANIEKAAGDRRTEIATEGQKAMGEAKRIHAEAVAAADKEYAEELARIEGKRRDARAAAKDQLANAEMEIRKAWDQEFADLESEARPHRERIAGELATCKERLAAHHRAAGMRDQIESETFAARTAAWKYEQLTLVLSRLEALRLEKLNHLPVAGLVVEEGEAYLDGIPWDKVNLSRRVEAVMQICTQRSGKLPLLIVDDAEHLDTETRAAIEGGLKDAGFQLIEAVVKDGPLSIEVA